MHFDKKILIPIDKLNNLFIFAKYLKNKNL